MNVEDSNVAFLNLGEQRSAARHRTDHQERLLP
jgi:hypothetical protein